ncbi:DUF1822 family protein [Scytonema sp. NUACC26]|uniref:DUF1822 family protein n=1 Tax=Scytonema sp. NUACC26 TaxID=3140176 RepID=UPI0038B347F1
MSPKVIWLEPEHFELAKEISDRNLSETYQWTIYLNALALLGFEEWLRERIPDVKINRDNYSIFSSDSTHAIDVVYHLSLSGFKLCLISVDRLIDEFVSVPKEVINSPEKIAHFYVLIEVLEEEEKLTIHGFFRYDKIVKYCHSMNCENRCDCCYHIPLSYFDFEVNNLLLYSCFLSPNAIHLPSVNEVVRTDIQSLSQTKSIVNKAIVNVRNWWFGVFEEGWQSTKDILNTLDSNYAWGSVRSQSMYICCGVKQIDFGLLINGQKLALIINIKGLKDNEIDVLVQVIPYNELLRNEEYLPSALKLKVTLNPNTSESESQEVTARKADNAIQLEFSEAPGKQFKVEVSYKNAVITENFLL